MPDGVAVHPIRAHRRDIADRPALDAFDGFDVTGVMPALRAGGDLEALDFASAAAAYMMRAPGPSTQTGFSVKMCLPAATAALKCAGRKPGGEARMT